MVLLHCVCCPEWAYRQLLQEGIDVNQSAEYGVTPLHVAAKHGHADIVML